MKLLWLSLSLLPFAGIVAVPTATKQESGSAKVDFERDLMPIVKASCIGCHNPKNSLGGLDLSTQEAWKKGGATESLIKGSPQDSYLMKRLRGTSGGARMPLNMPPLTPKQLGLFEQWISEGAHYESAPNFGSQILPIFKANCSSCHSGDHAKGGLNLLDPEKLKDSHVLTVKDGTSELIRRIKGEGGKPQMPMGFKPLTPAQIKLIDDWTKAGAPFTEGSSVHWSYQKPIKPTVPAISKAMLAKVGPAWEANHIDHFVLETLEEKGWTPSKPAAKGTLIRRLYLDVLGLPPSPEELDEVFKDQKPGWYDRLVDKLLQSPAYGERMARPWLDMARYADSNGYEKDLTRSAWLYRDYVVQAFNKNTPFSQFTIEQLAGDLLPNATVDQKIATGFNRNTMLNEEGGVDQAEAHYNVVIDRVGTTSTVWLGSSLACAQCHDHKYDPFSQKDFYKMYAVFNNTVITPTGDASVSEEKWREPDMEVPSSEQRQQLLQIQDQIKSVKKQIETTTGIEEDYAKWTSSGATYESAKPSQASATASSGATITFANEKFVVSGAKPDKDSYKLNLSFKAPSATGLLLKALPDSSLPSNGPGRGNGNFVLTKITVRVDGNVVEIDDASATFVQAGPHNLQDTIAGNENSGWAIYPEYGKPNQAAYSFKKPIVLDNKPVTVELEFNSPHVQHTLGSFAVELITSETSLNAGLAPAIREALKTNSKEARSFFDRFISPVSPLSRDISKAVARERQIKNMIPRAQVLTEKPTTGPLKANLHTGGAFLNVGEELTSGPPDILPTFKGSRFSRLELGKWLVTKENPLTARVRANQIWEMIFGQGIVETVNDFGTQGSPPSHPKLLDWLAVTFVEKGWDQKALMKLVLTSQTYQQSSAGTVQNREDDPNNVFLARGPRFRMEAEMIRDSALKIGGLLSLKMGGPSTMPYQPEGVWNSPYTGEAWIQSKGEDAYRRSLYTFWKRTAPFPTFIAFDASSREACTVQRVRTNTPLQALAMLNDPTMIEASRGLANKMAKVSPDRTEQIKYGFLACTGRRPNKDEISRIKSTWDRLDHIYAAKPEEAKKIAKDSQLAAATMTASVLINLDAALTKE